MCSRRSKGSGMGTVGVPRNKKVKKGIGRDRISSKMNFETEEDELSSDL